MSDTYSTLHIPYSKTQSGLTTDGMGVRSSDAPGCDAEGETQTDPTMFRPPIVRTGTAALNRALFAKKIDLAAAAVHDPRLIAKYRKTLQSSGELLRVDRISPIRPHPDQALADQGRKCLLLNPSIRPGGQIPPSLARRIASLPC